MSDVWPDASWQASDDSATDGRESTLLRLSCDKALQWLGWHAALQLPMTVDLTVKWYRQWWNQDTDLHSFTIGQIEQYTDLAGASGLAWSGA